MWIGTAVKTLREKRGIPIAELAKEAGCDPEELESLETRDEPDVDAKLLKGVADALCVSTNDICILSGILDPDSKTKYNALSRKNFVSFPTIDLVKDPKSGDYKYESNGGHVWVKPHTILSLREKMRDGEITTILKVLNAHRGSIANDRGHTTTYTTPMRAQHILDAADLSSMCVSDLVDDAVSDDEESDRL